MLHHALECIPLAAFNTADGHCSQAFLLLTHEQTCAELSPTQVAVHRVLHDAADIATPLQEQLPQCGTPQDTTVFLKLPWSPVSRCHQNLQTAGVHIRLLLLT
jgi:hypothetical protein